MLQIMSSNFLLIPVASFYEIKVMSFVTNVTQELKGWAGTQKVLKRNNNSKRTGNTKSAKRYSQFPERNLCERLL